MGSKMVKKKKTSREGKTIDREKDRKNKRKGEKKREEIGGATEREGNR